MSKFANRCPRDEVHKRILGALEHYSEGAIMGDFVSTTGLSESTIRQWLNTRMALGEVRVIGTVIKNSNPARVYQLAVPPEKMMPPKWLTARRTRVEKHSVGIRQPILDGPPRHPAPIAMYGMAYQ